MKRQWLVAVAMAMVLGMFLATQPAPAERDPGTPEAKKEKAHRMKVEAQKTNARRSVGAPYNKLELSEEQVAEINAIRQQTKQKIKQIKDAEKQSILGVLTPDQKGQLDRMEQEAKAVAAEKAKERGDKAAKTREQKKLKDKAP